MYLCEICFKLFEESFTYINRSFLASSDRYHFACESSKLEVAYQDRSLWCDNYFQRTLFLIKDIYRLVFWTFIQYIA